MKSVPKASLWATMNNEKGTMNNEPFGIWIQVGLQMIRISAGCKLHSPELTTRRLSFFTISTFCRIIDKK